MGFATLTLADDDSAGRTATEIDCEHTGDTRNLSHYEIPGRSLSAPWTERVARGPGATRSYSGELFSQLR